MNHPPKISSNKLETRTQTCLELYQDPLLVTLYRYENMQTPYDDDREGVVSRKELVGSWFTDSVKSLGEYIKMRQPGGIVVTVRVLKERLAVFNAANIEETRDMDREPDNFIIPADVQSASRLEIPLAIETKNNKKFQFNEWEKVNEFLKAELSDDKLVERAANTAQ